MNTDSQPIQVIIVDDDNDDLELFREMLNDLEIDTVITSAENCSDLIALLETFPSTPPPNLIFLDINMPCQTGIECLTELRREKKYSCIPVIMFTTSSAEHDVDLCYECGANLYLPKEIFFRLPNHQKGDMLLNWRRYIEKPSRENFVVKLDMVN
jgi:CheY-like chemotaxis protein